jgi:hypothetical protein
MALRNSARLLRLGYGDSGFLAWASAKMAFGKTVIKRLEEKDEWTARVFRNSMPSGVVVFS